MTKQDINRGWVRLITIFAIGLLPVRVDAAESAPIQSFSAEFKVRYGLLGGTMSLALSRDDSAYVYETSLSPSGIVAWFKRGAITERTTLMVTDGTIRPVDYTNRDTIANPARYAFYSFDRSAGRVTGQYKSQTIDEPMQAGGQNRISVHIAVMLALKSGAEISRFSVFDRGRWKDYQFEVFRDQTTKTRLGTFDTVEVRYASSDSDKTWSLYFAEKLDYLPVMLVFREGGNLKSRATLTDYVIGNPNDSPRE